MSVLDLFRLDDKVVIVTPDGMGVAPASPSEGAKGKEEESVRPTNPADLVDLHDR